MDTLLFAESLLCWCAANYAFHADPVHEDEPQPSAAKFLRGGWFVGVVVRSALAALLLALAGRFDHVHLVIASLIFVGSLLIPWTRRFLIPVRFLLEFELAVNCGFALAFWFVSAGAHTPGAAFAHPPLNQNRIAALCLGAAILLYMIRGGNYMVRGILKKAGDLPDAGDPGFESAAGYAHGRMIGQIERIIVVLIVMAGNLSALAFFFAAKGLIRSKELEERPRADYFLLGSLSSFLIALVAGLILQKTWAILWK